MPSKISVDQIAHSNETNALEIDTSGNVTIQQDLKFAGNAAIKDSAGNNVISESAGLVTVNADAAVISGSSTGDLVRITQTGTGNALVVEDDTNPDSTPFVVDSVGNVGVGTNLPTANLHINSNTPGIRLQETDGTTTHNTSLFVRNADSLTIQTRDNSNNFVSTDYSISSNSSGANSHSFRIGNSEKMRIDQNGNITTGGLASAARGPLHVHRPDTSDCQIHLTNNATGTDSQSGLTIYSNTTSAGIWSRESVDFRFAVSNSEKMRLDQYGHFYLNRFESTQGANSGDSGLFYNRSSGYLVLGNGGEATCIMNRWTSQGNIVQYRYNGSVVGSISTNTNSLPSDRNFKKDINDLNLGLELVKKLKPKSYRYNIDDDNSPFMTGLIAQDLEESLAEVGVVQNESWILQYNENVEEGNSKYELDYSKLIPVLAKAIQEQQTLIESQQSQIDALTTRIEALEAN